MLIKKFLLIAVVFLLAACAIPQKKSSWPAAMPPYSHFKAYYLKDPAHMKVVSEQEYIKWIKNFYLGSIYYRKGWLEVTTEVLATLPNAADKRIAEEKLYLIGRDASSEWAKNRAYRLINLRHIILWGNTINESMVRKEQIKKLTEILNDIYALLNEEIKASDITPSRYYQLEVADNDELLFE